MGVGLFIPRSELAGLSVPPLAITDGSADPVWVDTPCEGRYLYSRRPTIRLPFDAATADVVRRRIRHLRRQRTVWFPISATLALAALATWLLPGDDDVLRPLRLVLYPLALVVMALTRPPGKKLAVAQWPELVGRFGVLLPAVSEPVAREWTARNPAILMGGHRPRLRRYPPRVYGWSSGACAAAGLGVWFAWRADVFPQVTLPVLLLLVGATIVLAWKALPVGLIRFDDAA